MFASVISRRLEQLLPQLPDEGGVGGGGEADPAVRGAPGHPWPGGPTEGPWLTLYFLPGLHEVGLDFLIKTNRSHHIPGEAVVFWTQN